MIIIQQWSDSIDHAITQLHLHAFRKKRFGAINRLNLIYHIAPIASNNIWRINIDLLRPHLHKFDRIVIGVVTGESMVPIELVQKEIVGYEIDWVIRANNPMLGEAVTFAEMLAKVASTHPGEATFYAHTKGVSKPGNAAVEMWRKAMYQSCLSDVEGIKEILQFYSCAGAFKKRGPQDAWKPVNPGHFHFAGTFFWFRNDEIFSNPEWLNVRGYRYGVEEYLGRFLCEEDAACLYGDYAGNLYDPAEFNRIRNCFFSAARMLGHPMKKYLTNLLGLMLHR